MKKVEPFNSPTSLARDPSRSTKHSFDSRAESKAQFYAKEAQVVVYLF